MSMHMCVPPLLKTTTLAGAALGILLSLGAAAQAQDASARHVPLQKSIGVPHVDRPVPSLAVINATGAELAGTKLTLTGVSANIIVFADRPVRAAGHETIQQFLSQWDQGKDSFAIDPPNATVSVLSAKPGEVADAVVELKAPKLDGTTLTFEVTVLEGQPLRGGPVALFIDAWAVRGPYGGGVAHVGGYRGVGYYHPPVYHGAWYAAPAPAVGAAAVGLAAGAAIGAAAASRPACGYYPYPPCY